MAVPIVLTDPADSRLTPYRNLRFRDPQKGFIAEGPYVVERLLDSQFGVRSVLAHQGQASRYAERIPEHVDFYAISPELGKQLAGYDFHRGVLAHGECPASQGIESLIHQRPRLTLTMVGIGDPENVGSMLRTASAMGVQDILLDPTTISPFVRRVVRVSMASVFGQQFYEMNDPAEDLKRLHQAGFCSLATTLRPNEAVPIDQAKVAASSKPCLLMLGNEANGLPVELQAAASIRTHLPMHEGTDSLNVSVAAAIYLHRLTTE